MSTLKKENSLSY